MQNKKFPIILTLKIPSASITMTPFQDAQCKEEEIERRIPKAYKREKSTFEIGSSLFQLKESLFPKAFRERIFIEILLCPKATPTLNSW